MGGPAALSDVWDACGHILGLLSHPPFPLHWPRCSGLSSAVPLLQC